MAKKQTTKKLKKKKWYPILAPKILGGRVIGESLLADSNSMKGRYITMNLMNITGDPKKQGVNLQFKIKDVKEGQGVTEIVKYELLPSATKRLIRRGKSKIDDSFLLKTKQGVLRVKTLIITNHTVFKSISSSVRLTTRKILKEMLVKKDFEQNVEELLKATIQKEVKTKISKITPIRAFNIRVLKLEEKGRQIDQEVVKEAPKEEKSEEKLVEEEKKKEETTDEKKEEKASAEENKEETTKEKSKEKVVVKEKKAEKVKKETDKKESKKKSPSKKE